MKTGAKLSAAEIDAWCNRTGNQLDTDEFDIIMRMDRTYTAAMHELERDALNAATEKGNKHARR